MKYIRTKDGKIGKVISVRDYNGGKPTFYHVQFKNDKEIYSDYELDIIAQADTIEELCEEFVCQENDYFYWLASRENVSFRDLPNCYCKAIFGAIWTDKGLIYVAKMNDKGELCLI